VLNGSHRIYLRTNLLARSADARRRMLLRAILVCRWVKPVRYLPLYLNWCDKPA
jgi:hypothetical protein